MDKYTEGFLIGLNEKNWKYLKVKGVSPEEYLILSHIFRKYDLQAEDKTLSKFSKTQRANYGKSAKVAGYIDSFQILEDVKKAGTIGGLFSLWDLSEVEKSASVGMIAGVNRELQQIAGLAESAILINTYFGTTGKGLTASPIPWARVAGIALVGLSTVLPILIKDNTAAPTIKEMTGVIKKDLPPLPDRTTPEKAEKYENKQPAPKIPKKPASKPAKKGGDWFAPIRKAIIPTGAATGLYEMGKGGAAAIKDTGKGIKDNMPLLIVGGLALYYLVSKK